jgi:hypothetical protein
MKAHGGRVESYGVDIRDAAACEAIQALNERDKAARG